MLFIILASIVAYLATGLFSSRVYWQGTDSHGRDEILATLMVFLWPLCLAVLGGMWLVTHGAK